MYRNQKKKKHNRNRPNYSPMTTDVLHWTLPKIREDRTPFFTHLNDNNEEIYNLKWSL